MHLVTLTLIDITPKVNTKVNTFTEVKELGGIIKELEDQKVLEKVFIAIPFLLTAREIYT